MGASCRMFHEEPLAAPMCFPSGVLQPSPKRRGLPRPRPQPRTRAGFSFGRTGREPDKRYVR
jgi:hypothetical protein